MLLDGGSRISLRSNFEKALYSVQPSFPPGKLPPVKEFSNVYFNTSTGDGDSRGPWHKEPTFEFRDAQPAVAAGGAPETLTQSRQAAAMNRARLGSRARAERVAVSSVARGSVPFCSRA